ncbi:DUF2569 domain-containing protein [Corallincola spongiicola]|nr:DUF2569 domain-containing protein [Corallincola spongiicola]
MEDRQMDDDKKYQGIGGWLILVAIGVVLKPIVLLVKTLPIFVPIFIDDTWQQLTTAGSEYYHPMWAPLIIGEVTFNIGMLIASVALLYLFFTKHYRFPLLFILVSVVSLGVLPLDAWLTSFLFPDEPIFDPATVKELSQTAIVALIWIPYMLVSKRVRATFIEKRPIAADGLTEKSSVNTIG